MERLLTAVDCEQRVVDMCAFGAHWRKRTRVVCWARYHPPGAVCRCNGRKGMCGFRDSRHITLSGVDRSTGLLWTRLAEEYPRRF